MADDELLQTFIEETEDNLLTMEEGLLELEKDPSDQECIDKVFRAMHTIKGGAGLVGADKINKLAHHLENLLEKIRQSESILTGDIFNLLLNGTDLLSKLLKNQDNESLELLEQSETLIYSLQLFDKEEETSQAEESLGEEAPYQSKKYYRLELKFIPDIFETGTDPLMLIFELLEMGNLLESYINISKVPNLHQLDPYIFSIHWTLFIETESSYEDIKNIFIFVEDESDIVIDDISDELDLWFKGNQETGELLVERGMISPEEINSVLKRQKKIGEILLEEGKINKSEDKVVVQKKQSKREADQVNTIRVDTHKLEEILNQLAELLIAQSRVKELVFNTISRETNFDVETYNAFQEVDKIIRRVQEEVMNTSMVPIGGVFIRFQRMARDLAREKGKDVELKLSGKETELDKKVIEQIADPLKHLIRNSIDHGLEAPAERIEKGKKPAGTIHLNAFHQEGNIIIEISDDGRGINEEAVLAKAIEKGLVTSDAKLSSRETQRLLFTPGFSTAKEVTDISGRGVGLDVVMNNIKNMRGSVDLYSEKDKGTRFSVKLPLTLAIIDGMMVRVGDEFFIVPLNSITEFTKINAKDLNTIEGKGKIVNLRNEYIPFASLYQILRLEAQYKTVIEGIIVVLKDGRRKLALLVDEIIGQEQVVIKSMKENLGQVDGIAGATILGNGRVSIILDVPSIFRLARHHVEDLDNDSEQSINII